MTYNISALNKRIEIEVDVLDLQGQPDEVLERIKRLACKVRQHKLETTASQLAA